MIGIAWQLSHWRFFELQLPGRGDRTRHCIGYSLALRVPKISAPLVELDPASKHGTDDLGNVFEFIGVSRAHDDVAREWDIWIARNQAHDVVPFTNATTARKVQGPPTLSVNWKHHETEIF